MKLADVDAIGCRKKSTSPDRRVVGPLIPLMIGRIDMGVL